VAGYRRGTFLVATVDARRFLSAAPTARLEDSGDALAPRTLTVSARAGPPAKAHRKLGLTAMLGPLGLGTAPLGTENVGTFSVCPGGARPCKDYVTGPAHPGNLQIVILDDGYGIASGIFDFQAGDGLGGTSSVIGGVFRARYR
jgi:hypothetical protein